MQLEKRSANFTQGLDVLGASDFLRYEQLAVLVMGVVIAVLI